MRIEIFEKIPQQARNIREEVFLKEQGFQSDRDQIDDIAIHIVGFENDTPVATCRVFESETKGVYILGRLAVIKEYRGRGLGKEMIRQAEKCVKEIDGESLTMHSQLHAKEFYSKLGYQEYGQVEYEQNQPHIWMKKRF